MYLFWNNLNILINYIRNELIFLYRRLPSLFILLRLQIKVLIFWATYLWHDSSWISGIFCYNNHGLLEWLSYRVRAWSNNDKAGLPIKVVNCINVVYKNLLKNISDVKKRYHWNLIQEWRRVTPQDMGQRILLIVDCWYLIFDCWYLIFDIWLFIVDKWLLIIDKWLLIIDCW